MPRRTDPRLVALVLLAGPLGCGQQEVGGNPPPNFEVLEGLDRTPDPSCTATWLAGIRGRVVDGEGRGVRGATVQHCLRLGERFVCTSPPPGPDGTPQLDMTDPQGWYAYVFDEDVRCADELAVRVLVRPAQPGGRPPYGTAYCSVPLEPDDGVQLLPHPAVLQRVVEPVELPELGDPSAPRAVTFAGGVTITGLIPDDLFGGDYEQLAGGPVPLDPAPCYLRDLEFAEDFLGLYTFAPEFDSEAPLGLLLPNDTGLPDGSTVLLYALGGLDTRRADGSAILEAAFEAFGTGTVVEGSIVSDEGVALPSTSVIGWRPTPR